MTQEQFLGARTRGLDALKRGREAFRRVAGPPKSELQDDLELAQAEVERMRAEKELRDKLDFANSEVDRLRKLVHKERKAVDRWKSALRTTRLSLADPLPGLDLPDRVGSVIEQSRAEHLTYLGVPELTVLARQAYDAGRSGREGLIIEAGTARGGSAIVMAAAKDPAQPMKVYDVFGQIPEPTDADGKDVHARYEKITQGGARGIAGDTYYGYRDDLFAEVTDSFSRLGISVGENNVELIKGLFEDTIEVDEPVAFAHLDGDWYESTMTCLERITPHLVKGGRLVLDDYYHWSGARKAVDDYFANRSGYQLERRRKLHVVRL